jgi:hypothetical protein
MQLLQMVLKFLYISEYSGIDIYILYKIYEYESHL